MGKAERINLTDIKNKVIKNSSPNREWYAYHTVDGEDLFYSVTSVAEING